MSKIDYAHQIIPFSPRGEDIAFSPQITQIQAGGDGVWAINSNEEVFALQYSAAQFHQVFGILLVSISVGSGGGVWGIDPSGQVYAFSTP